MAPQLTNQPFFPSTKIFLRKWNFGRSPHQMICLSFIIFQLMPLRKKAHDIQMTAEMARDDEQIVRTSKKIKNEWLPLPPIYSKLTREEPRISFKQSASKWLPSSLECSGTGMLVRQIFASHLESSSLFSSGNRCPNFFIFMSEEFVQLFATHQRGIFNKT